MNTKEIIKELEKLKKNIPDLIVKKIKVSLFKCIYIITNETVSSSDRVNNFILKYFSNKSIINLKVIDNFKKDIKENIPSINYKSVKTKEELMEYIFSGFTLVIYNNEVMAYETRADLDRGVTEPSSEPVIRGPKDSFTENYNKNIGLIRKRLKSEHLTLEELTVGKQTHTKVGIMYMDNICEENIVTEIKDTINKIEIDGIFDVNNFKEYVVKRKYTLFPTLIYSEKPDDASRFLLEGRVIITIENSPSIIIAPTFFMDYFKNSEDYYHKSFYATFIRMIRFTAFVLSIITPALFIAIITYDQEILPLSLLINFTEQRSAVPFPAIIEAFVLMFTFELLYEGDSRTPFNRGTSLSILGALVLGDAAVNAGLISPIMVIVISIASLSNLIFIYYDMQGAIRFWRYILMIFSSFFGLIGFLVGATLLIINLCSIESFGKPYTLPVAPLIIKDLGDSLIKTSIAKNKKRPSFLTKKNIIREDTK